MTLQLSVAQLNFTVGDMPGNAHKIIDAARAVFSGGRGGSAPTRSLKARRSALIRIRTGLPLRSSLRQGAQIRH
jgi:hypothetical protein